MKIIARALPAIAILLVLASWSLFYSSAIARGSTGGIAALLFLAWFQSELVANARAANPRRVVLFWDLVVTADDEKYSLSRLQLYLWFVVIITSYTAVCFAAGKLIVLDEGLNLLLGINAAASVASTALTTLPPSAPIVQPATVPGSVPGAAAPPTATTPLPNFVRDIFFERPGSLDLTRTQMFAWTVVIILGFLFAIVKSFKEGNPELPNIPISLAALMGISHGAYLGAKAVKP